MYFVKLKRGCKHFCVDDGDVPAPFSAKLAPKNLNYSAHKRRQKHK